MGGERNVTELSEPAVNTPVTGPPRDLAVGRIDDDLWPDVVAVSPVDSSVSVLFGLPDGRLTRDPEPTPVGEGASSVVLADVDGDGRPEIATGNGTAGSVTVLLGVGRP
jgi:hypothetical protein